MQTGMLKGNNFSVSQKHNICSYSEIKVEVDVDSDLRVQANHLINLFAVGVQQQQQQKTLRYTLLSKQIIYKIFVNGLYFCVYLMKKCRHTAYKTV